MAFTSTGSMFTLGNNPVVTITGCNVFQSYMHLGFISGYSSQSDWMNGTFFVSNLVVQNSELISIDAPSGILITCPLTCGNVSIDSL